MRQVTTDLPFKLGDHPILVVKGLPVEQCTSCSEYMLDDHVMQEVEDMVDRIDPAAELEVRQYAA